MTLRYGLVGTGMMGIEHINNVAITPGAEIAALFDPSETSLSRAKEALGADADPQIFASSAELAKAGLDAVIVASPNHTHRAVLEPLFDAGLNILCEKPIATTIDDLRWIVERAAKSPGIFWTAMEYRFMPPAAQFVRQVHERRAGNLQMLSIREHRFPFLVKVGDWN